jgi:hypothetical protein
VAPEYARPAARLARKFLDERALAGARFAADEHNFAGAASRIAQKLRQFSELSLALQQVHGDLEVSVKARRLGTGGATWGPIARNLGISPDWRPMGLILSWST